MTSLRDTRNEDIFRLVERTSFGFETWLVVVKTIGSPTATEVSFSFRPSCSPITTIYASVAATSTYLDLLSKNKQGDRLVVTGRFLATAFRFALQEKPTKPGDLEGSITDDGAITAPEYWAVITLLK